MHIKFSDSFVFQGRTDSSLHVPCMFFILRMTFEGAEHQIPFHWGLHLMVTGSHTVERESGPLEQLCAYLPHLLTLPHLLALGLLILRKWEWKGQSGPVLDPQAPSGDVLIQGSKSLDWGQGQLQNRVACATDWGSLCLGPTIVLVLCCYCFEIGNIILNVRPCISISQRALQIA